MLAELIGHLPGKGFNGELVLKVFKRVRQTNAFSLYIAFDFGGGTGITWHHMPPSRLAHHV